MWELTPVSPPEDDGGIKARHSSMLVAKSTSIRGSLVSPMISCLENRSKSYNSIQRVLFVMSLYGIFLKTNVSLKTGFRVFR